MFAISRIRLEKRKELSNGKVDSVGFSGADSCLRLQQLSYAERRR